jgi:hypothetical protein
VRNVAVFLSVLGGLIFLQASPAFAGKGDEVGAGLLIPIVVAFFAYPVGLAFHGLILAFAPRRGRGLVSNLEHHRGKTVVLGIMNTVFLVLFALTLKKGAPVLSVLAILLGFTLALVGSYGIARGLGARVLGRPIATDGSGELKEICVGWFVFVFALAIPGLGILLGVYWGVRATGGVVLTLFKIPAGTDDDDDAPGDLSELLPKP